MLLFIGENYNGFFWTLACESTNHRAGSQLKILKRISPDKNVSNQQQTEVSSATKKEQGKTDLKNKR